MSPLDHMVFSVVANLAALAAVAMLKSAPPRLVVNVCLAGMFMVAVPWGLIAQGLASAGVHRAAEGLSMVAGDGATPAFSAWQGSTGWPWATVLVGVWIAVGTVWLTVTFVAGVRARRRWRARALPAESLKGHVLERFKPLADRVEIHRVPDSRMAMATGLWRREIWIGERISAPGHVATALNHELCHLDSGDHYVVHLVSLLERTLWWNPLIWMLGRIARRHLEYHCDQRCKRHLGAHQYRRNLAEMVLDRMPANAFPALNFGRPSGVMKRMERLTMTYSTKPAHVLSLAALGVVLAFGSAALADDPPKPSLLDCKDQLPQGVQYRLEIKSTMNTRDEDPQNQISVTLLDELKPGSVEVPKGAGPYVRCVLDLVGVPEEEYPEGV